MPAPGAPGENAQEQQLVQEDPLAKDLWAFASKKMKQSKCASIHLSIANVRTHVPCLNRRVILFV